LGLGSLGFIWASIGRATYSAVISLVLVGWAQCCSFIRDCGFVAVPFLAVTRHCLDVSDWVGDGGQITPPIRCFRAMFANERSCLTCPSVLESSNTIAKITALDNAVYFKLNPTILSNSQLNRFNEM
jgi:hypothetical protein